MQPKMKNIKES